MDVHIRQLYMQFLSGQDAGSGPAPFFQPTPPPPPPPPPQAPVPMQMQRVWAGNAFGLAPGEGSLTAGGDAFLGDDQLVDGFEEDTLALMRMTADELSALLSDGPGVDPLCVPPEFPMGSLDQTAMADSPSVPAAGGASQSASGSLGLGAAQARASDSPASGVVDPLTRMSQTSSGSPVLGSAQARASDSPASGVVDPLTRMSGDGLSAFMSDGAAVNSLCMPPECPMSSLVAYQPAMDDSPPVLAGWSNQSSSGSPGLGCAQARATDSPAAYLDAPQQVPDSETAEVARMVRVAERCGDRPSTSWSVEEDQLLIQGLSRFAGQDNVIRCFSIASQLEEKTALDVAYRIRWLTDLEKKKAAKEVQLGQEKPGGGNVTKGKGTKVANKKHNKHPPSKEALDSRSAKDIIRDNNRLMDKIEEILRTGEVNNCPDYFYYVKMNMDAMQNKVKDLGSVMEGLSAGDAEWEDVLKDRHDTPQAGEDAATPAP